MRASKEFVHSIVTNHQVWPWLAEDCDKPSDYWPPDADYFRHGDQGYMEFRRAAHHWCQIHIGMLRGAKGVPEFVRECMDVMRADGVKRFTGMISAKNRAAIVLAYRCGFRYLGTLPGVLLKDGEPTDMIVMGAE